MNCIFNLPDGSKPIFKLPYIPQVGTTLTWDGAQYRVAKVTLEVFTFGELRGHTVTHIVLETP